MGERGLYGFRKDGVDKLTYNHWDSNPDGLGKTMAEFLVRYSHAMDRVYDSIELVDKHIPPTSEEIKRCLEWGYFNDGVATGSKNDWYCLLRNTQGSLEPYKRAAIRGEKMYMIDKKDFIKDSAFCVYAYIFNLDTQRLEFWVGLQRDPQPGNRYGELPDEFGYYPCRLVTEFWFDDTLEPDEIVAWMKEREGEMWEEL